MLQAAWRMVMPVTPLALTWMVFLSSILFVQVPIQDFRDMDGDRKVGRRTFPIVYGASRARELVACMFAMVFVAITIMFDPFHFAPRWAIVIFLNTTGSLIVMRLLLFRSKAADDKTYRLFVQWHVVLLILTTVPLSQS
jgi:4-hydroxybenzoate polyprenyltransferase